MLMLRQMRVDLIHKQDCGGAGAVTGGHVIKRVADLYDSHRGDFQSHPEEPSTGG